LLIGWRYRAFNMAAAILHHPQMQGKIERWQ
jgi:hypothetical protein